MEVNPHKHDLVELLGRESLQVWWCSLCGQATTIEGHNKGTRFETYEVGSRKPIVNDRAY